MSSNASDGGIGICGVLALIFITLKLAEVGTVAQWSWWWVLSPLWIPAAIVLPIAGLAIVIAVIGEYLERRRNLRREMERP